MSNLKIFTPSGVPVDAGAVEQMQNCMSAGDAIGGSLSADHHLGYSMPIGGSIAYPEHISPSGVGYDIGCGNKAVKLDLRYDAIKDDMGRIMDDVVRRISFGVGQPAAEKTDHQVIEDIRNADSPYQAKLVKQAADQLGTVGAGNHYVDIFVDEYDDRVWVGVHFGSRGFGHKTATGFLNIAHGLPFDAKPVSEGLFDPPALLHVTSGAGEEYIKAMQLAGDYAYAGRDIVVAKVVDILGNPEILEEVHNHHNFAWQETHNGETAWVVRKGATPLFPGQLGFVGGSMGEHAAIIRGNDGWILPEEQQAAEDSLWSAPHGAGRIMSRNEAKGKSKKRWYCRTCGKTQQHGEGGWSAEQCPHCLGEKVAKKWVTESKGKIDWDGTLETLSDIGVTLRGGAADEAPDAYKNLPEVLAAHRPYVEVVASLRPVGVAMAGADTVDPFRD